MHPLLEKFNPFRDPAWRQSRVLELVEHKPRPKPPDREHDDDYVKEYRDFLLKWRRGNEYTRLKLFCMNPGLFYAHNFREQPDLDWRTLLEARILTKEPDQFIADEFNTIPETVHWYERLFFNVRDRLHSRTYIVKTVLGPSAQLLSGYDDMVTDVMQRVSYKMFAYFGGPLVLDMIISGFQAGPFPQKSDKAVEWIDNAVKTTIQQRSAIAARSFTINRWSVMQLLEIQQRFMQSEAEARAASGGASADYQANIERFFEAIPLAIGRRASEGRTKESLFFEGTAAEPNFEEQMVLVQGTVPESLKLKLEFKRPAIEEKEVIDVSPDKDNE